MDNLSIVIRDTKEKIYKHLEILKPLLKDNKAHLVLINNDVEKFDLSFDYSLYEFSEEYSKFENFYKSICLNDNILLIEKGIELNNDIIKVIEENVSENINVIVKIKKYIDENKTKYLINKINILSNDKSTNFRSIDRQLLDDLSLISFTLEDIETNLYKLLDIKQYDAIYEWYNSCILNKEAIYEEKFFESLEILKSKLDIAELEKVNKPFLTSSLNNRYKSYLITRALYEEKKEGFEEQIKVILGSKDFNEKNIYFSNFIKLLFKDEKYCLELIKRVKLNALDKYIKYLLEIDNTFYLDIYNFIMSIDLNKEISIENNENIPIIMDVLRSYISYMGDKSADIKKKNILIQMFLDYTNYGFYSLNKLINTNKNLHLDDEIKFLIEMDKVVEHLNKNFINEAISILRKAGEEYELMTMPVRYYTQKLIRDNNIYPYKLSICMMAKNEEKFLDKCLNSIKPLLDSGIAELVFVDTGSTDKTVEIANNYVEKIYHKMWEGNFSKMRNYCISLAQGEYIVILDADEEVELGKADEIINLFTSEEYKQFNTYAFKAKNFNDEKLKDYSMFARVGIFKNREDFYYYGSVHNQPNKLGPINHLDIILLHYGYIMTEDIKDKKFERTTRLLKNELQKDPYHLYYRMQLSTSYSMHGDHEKALEQVELYMKQLKSTELTKGLRMMALNNAVIIYSANGLYYKMIEVCTRGLEVEPTFVDFIYNKALAHFALEEYNQAIKEYISYLKLIENIESLDILNDDRYIFYSLDSKNQALDKLLICYYKSKDLENFNKVIEGINDNTLLKHCIYTVLKFYIEHKKYSYIKKFFIDKVVNNSNYEIKYIFSCAIREITSECNYEEKRDIINEFNDISTNDDYVDTIKMLINSESASSTILDFVNRYDLEELNLITAKMVLDKTYPLLADFINVKIYTIKEIKALKNSALFILNRTINAKLFKGMTKKELLIIAKNYIKLCSELLIKERYDLVTEKEIQYINIIDSAFKDFNNNKLTEGLRKVRDAVRVHGEMARPMQLYLETIIPEYSANLDYFSDNEESSINNALNEYSKKIKTEIEQLINTNLLTEAKDLIIEYEKIIKEDLDICSMKAIISIMENKFDEAEDTLLRLIQVNKDNFDANYNLGYLYQLKTKNNLAIKYYNIAYFLTDEQDMKHQLESLINILSTDK